MRSEHGEACVEVASVLTGRADGKQAAWITAAVFALMLTVYAVLLPPSILPGDSGELIAASRTLSIAHTPGSPLYLMLGRMFSSAVPLGSVAYRYNLLSAVLASLAVALFYRLLRRLGPGDFTAAALALALGVQQAFWLQAVEAEVYALSALFTVLMFYIAFSPRRNKARAFLLLAFTGGLAVGHHTALVYAFAGALLVLLLTSRYMPAPREVALGVFFVLLGASVLIYIPVRAGLHPPLTWGHTDTLEGFVSHVLGTRYGWRLKPIDLPARAGDVMGFFKMMTEQAGWPLALLALAGLGASLRNWRLALPLGCVMLLYAVHSASYQTHDIEGHVMPAVVVLGILAGLGARAAAGRLTEAWPRWGPAVMPVFVAAVLAAGALSLSPRRDPWLAHDFAVAVAESATEACGARPVVLASGEFVGLPVLYIGLVEGYDIIPFAPGTSDPSVLGAAGPIESLEEAVMYARRNLGGRRVAILGGSKAASMGGKTSICGMVYALEAPASGCRSPRDYEVRGVGAEPRDYYSRVLSAEYLLHLSRYDLSRGDTSEARDDIDRAAALAYDDAITNVEASRLYLEIGDAPRAEELLHAALHAEPDYFYAHFALANVHSLNGDYAQALAEYRKALRGSPEPGAVHVNMGNTLRSMGDYAASLDEYAKALALDPRSLTANLGMGVTLEAMGRYDEALARLDSALAADPDYPPALHAKAALLMKLGRYGEARAAVEHGLAVAPDDALLLADMGLNCLRTGALDGAIAYLGRALDVSPGLLTARGNLAVAYERIGMKAEAAAQYEKYIADAPPGPGRDRAEQALRALRE
jgi:tetratricopeptide (TPR) repeat protein